MSGEEARGHLVKILVAVMLIFSLLLADRTAHAEDFTNPNNGVTFYCDYYSSGYWCYSDNGGVWFRAMPGFTWGG